MAREAAETIARTRTIGTDGVGMSQQGELIHLRGFEFPSGGDDVQQEAWFTINNLLGTHESYAPDSAVASHVQDRLNLIAGGEHARAVVVHDDELNAFAVPGFIAVSDGLLKILEHQEELDALLAHEWVHIAEDHAHDHEEGADIVSSVGRQRVHETEADLAAFELLDRRGINVRGMMTLFDKMDGAIKAKEAEQKPKRGRKVDEETPKFKIGDVTHGSLVDRRLNLEEILWLMDVRNLTTEELTPLAVETAHFEEYQKDSELLSRYDELDTLSKRHLIQRQLNRPGGPADAEVGLSTRDLVQRQRDLFKSTVPELIDDEVSDLTEISLKAGYGLFHGSEYQGNAGSSLETAMGFFGRLNQPVLRELGIKLDHKVATDLGSKVLSGFFYNHQPDIDEYRGIVEQVRAQWDDRDFGWKPIIEHAMQTGTLDDFTQDEWREFIAESEGSLDSMFDYLFADVLEGYNKISDDFYKRKITTYDVLEKLGGPVAYVAAHADWSAPSNQAKERFVRSVANYRLSKARSLADPIEFFRYIAIHDGGKYTLPRDLAEEREVVPLRAEVRDLEDEYEATDSSVKQRRISRRLETLKDEIQEVIPIRRPDEVGERIITIMESNSIDKIVGRLKTYAESHILTRSDNEWLALLSERYSRALASGSIDRVEDPGDPDSDAIVTKKKLTGSLESSLFLWALQGTKDLFLETLGDEVPSRSRSTSTIEGISELIDLIYSVPEQVKTLGFPLDWEVSQEDLQEVPSLLNIALRKYLEAAARAGNAGILLDALDKIALPAISPERFSTLGVYREAVKQWEKITRRLVEHPDEDPQETLLQLFAVSVISENVQVNLQAANGALEQLVETMSFQDACDLIFVRFAHLPQRLFIHARDYLIENKARTLEEFAQLETFLRRSIETFASKDEFIGKLSLTDSLFFSNYAATPDTERVVGAKQDEVHGLEPTRLLQAMLESAHNDRALQEYIFERWWLYQRSHRKNQSDVVDAFTIEDLATFYYPSSKDARFRWWADQGAPLGSYAPFTEVAQNAYLASTAVKYYLLRKILLEEGGVLTTPEGRKSSIETLESTWIDFGDSADAQSIVHTLLTTLSTVARPDELYQRINPVLLDLVLRLPEEGYEVGDLASSTAARELARMQEQGLLTRPIGEREQSLLTQKMLQLLTAGVGVVRPEDRVNSPTTQLLSLFSDGATRQQSGRFSPLDLALTVGEKSGAVGVRMLQLGGQYFDIPDAEKERFMDVYDSQRGQSRLQAYRTLKREAETVPEVAAFMEEIAEFGPRIGGGSLMTVYEVTLKDGSREAIAVRNPNVKYHVDKVVRVLERTLQEVRRQDPTNANYQLAQALLSDVEEWIANELDDPNFEEKDIRFKGENDTDSAQYDPGRSRYKILVPSSTPTGTRWMRRDKFVDGKNLTALAISEEATDISVGRINGEDYKQAISLLVRNYLYQLTETGLVHSDIHPGNFRVTSDNASIAVFDRYNMLELNEGEQALIRGLIPAIATGGVQSALSRTVSYLFDHERNGAVQDIREEIMTEVLQNGNGNLEGSILNALVTLKQRGVYVPLTVSLIAKNLFALNTLAQGAGFRGVVDAYATTAGNDEVMKLLSRGNE